MKEPIRKLIQFLWKLGFTDLTREEMASLEGLSQPVGVSTPSKEVLWPSMPIHANMRPIFGRLDNADWLLTDPATRRAMLATLTGI